MRLFESAGNHGEAPWDLKREANLTAVPYGSRTELTGFGARTSTARELLVQLPQLAARSRTREGRHPTMDAESRGMLKAERPIGGARRGAFQNSLTGSAPTRASQYDDIQQARAKG